MTNKCPHCGITTNMFYNDQRMDVNIDTDGFFDGEELVCSMCDNTVVVRVNVVLEKKLTPAKK